MAPPNPELAAHKREILDLAESVAVRIDAQANPLHCKSLDLANGVAGQALFFAELSRYRDKHQRFSGLARACLDKITAELPAAKICAGLFNGIAGIAWAVERVAVALEYPVWNRAGHQEICDFIEACLSRNAAPLEFDLVNGLAGIGIWALGSAGEPHRRRLAALAVSRLDQCAEAQNPGIAWRTPAHRRSASNAASGGESIEYNLGVAHGVPGVIGFLARCVEARIEVETARRLLCGAAQWMLAQSLNDPVSSYSYTTGSRMPSRLAWCYGDPGIAVVLQTAARILHSPQLVGFSGELAERSARRRLDTSQVEDTGLCHGAAGLVLAYGRLAQTHGSAALHEARRYWMDRLLDLRSDAGLAGFYSWSPQTQAKEADPGLLCGASGVGLTLLSQVSRRAAWAYPLLFE